MPVPKLHNKNRRPERRTTMRYSALIRTSWIQDENLDTVKLCVGNDGEGQLFKADDLIEFAAILAREAMLLRENEKKMREYREGGRDRGEEDEE